jgi:sugar/nucleoside kinase (ribokinase family)
LSEAALWSPHDRRELDVVGVGENSLDQVCVVERFPVSGEKQTVVAADTRPGGQIATSLLACARLGMRCRYLGVVGDDDARRRVLAPLREANIDLVRVQRVSGAATRSAVILVELGAAERTVLAHRDGKLLLRTEVLSRDDIACARILAVDTTDPDASSWACGVAREAGCAVVMDADEASPRVLSLLEQVDFPIVSSGFAESMGAGGAPERALRELAARGAKLSVVTLGHRGSIARIGDRTIESPAYSVKAIDTTGAGDAFRGGFIWALSNRKGPVAALRAANAAAAMNCRALGAQGGLPNRGALEAFIAEREPGYEG